MDLLTRLNLDLQVCHNLLCHETAKNQAREDFGYAIVVPTSMTQTSDLVPNKQRGDRYQTLFHCQVTITVTVNHLVNCLKYHYLIYLSLYRRHWGVGLFLHSVGLIGTLNCARTLFQHLGALTDY